MFLFFVFFVGDIPFKFEGRWTVTPTASIRWRTNIFVHLKDERWPKWQVAAVQVHTNKSVDLDKLEWRTFIFVSELNFSQITAKQNDYTCWTICMLKSWKWRVRCLGIIEVYSLE